MKPTRILLSAVILFCSATAVRAQKLNLDEIEQSIGYINNLQNPDGGFRPTATETLSDLGAVTSSMRALKYLHPMARPRERELPKEFVMKCFDRSSGGFSNRPGDKPDVRSTAMGLMAMAELKMPVKDHADAISKYFVANAKTLGDIYITAAALNAAEVPPPKDKTAEWIATFEKTRNADGSYGKEPADTAGAVNTILRLGGSLRNPDATAAIVRAAQQGDGGFAKPGEKSDLATTYRCMRALWMLKTKPNSDRLRAFIARCRNDDDGYGVQPGQPSSTSGTYYAAIVMHWLEELQKN